MKTRVAALLAAAAVLAGCQQSPPLEPIPEVTLAPPTPAGMEQAPPDEAAQALPDNSTCDRTASLRPFPNQAQADEAVENIRNRGRLIVGLDIGSNLFSFRDPITGQITGFDVDIVSSCTASAGNYAPRSERRCRRPDRCYRRDRQQAR